MPKWANERQRAERRAPCDAAFIGGDVNDSGFDIHRLDHYHVGNDNDILRNRQHLDDDRLDINFNFNLDIQQQWQQLWQRP
jgi:hypothetical protein